MNMRQEELNTLPEIGKKEMLMWSKGKLMRKGIVFNAAALTLILSIWGHNSPALATDVCGGLFSDTTWTVPGSPYILTCNVTLFPGYTLTIEPGVTVKFNTGTTLTIRGTLAAVGTLSNRITFTSASSPTKAGGVAFATNLGGKGVIKFADFSYTSRAVSVECCWGVQEPANIAFSTFKNNDSAISGYAGNNIIIRNSVFENNNTAIDSADKIIYDSIFRNNNKGLNATERISVYHSLFEGNTVALYGGRGKIENCTIIRNGTGIQGFFEGFTLSGNTITQNDIGVILTQYDSYSPPVKCSNIFGNTTYNAKVTGSANKSAPNNWWGTTDTREIEAKIYDGRDDPNLGLLEYTPFLPGPIPALALLVNQPTFRPGQTLALQAMVNPGPAPVSVDVYAAIQLPDKTLLFWQGDINFTREIRPIVTNWTVDLFSEEVFRYTFGGSEQVGNYAWLGAFTQPGTLNIIGCIAETTFTFNR